MTREPGTTWGTAATIEARSLEGPDNVTQVADGQFPIRSKTIVLKREEPKGRYQALAVVELDEDGKCVSFSPSLPGAASQGGNPEEALANLREALAGCIESYLAAEEEIPWVRDAAFEGEAVLKRWIVVDV